MIKDTPDKELVKVLRLISSIRPDCALNIAKVDSYFCKHLRQDFGSYSFKLYLDFIEKKLVYEPGVINLGVIMTWGQEFKQSRTRTWTQEEKEQIANFYNGGVDTTN